MKASRRILLFGLAIAAAVLLVALAAILSAPLWVDTAAVKKEIVAIVHRATGDVVQLERLTLHLFSGVSVDIAHPRYSAAGGAEVAAESATIDLDFLALVSGRVQPRGIRVSGLQVTIHLPPPAPDRNPASVASVEQQLRDVLVQIGRTVPALSVAADTAIITLYVPGQPPFVLRVLHAQATTSGDSVNVELACASEAWQWLALKFSLKGNELTGSGLAEFTGLRVERLRSLLGGGEDWPIAEAETIGRIEWQMNGLSNVRAEAIASSSRILLQRNQSTQSLDGVVAAAGLETNGATMSLHLHRLYVAAPHLLMSANLISESNGQHRFDVQASGVDLLALQGAARNLAPDIAWIAHPPISLRAGTLTALELRGNGEAPPQLFDPSVLAGAAAFEGVAFDIAKPAIGLSAVEGRATFERGQLQVQDFKAVLGGSMLRKGKMSMNLLGHPLALQADAVVALDLAQALALARKLAPDEGVRRHLDAVEELKGSALVHIALSGDLRSPRTAIDASELDFSVRHRDLPLPIRLSRGELVYAGDTISISDAAGEIGVSGFSDLDASMKLAPPYRFDITQLTARLSMDELFPIAAARPELRSALAQLQAVSGAITLTNVQAEGSMDAPDAVNFRVGASPWRMKVNAQPFASPILLDGGQVDISNRHIEVRDVTVAALDSELRVSGQSEDYRAGLAAVDAVVRGRVGAETLHWIYQAAAIPRAYRINAPLRFADARIGWKKSGEVAFKGKVNIGGAADLFIDARKADTGFKFERITLKDPSSDASLGGEITGNIVKAWFKGKLAGETLTRLLAEPALSLGSIEGDIAVDMDLGKPEELHAKGQLNGTAIASTADLAVPVGVERIVLAADGRKITVSDTVLSSGENLVQLDGSIYRENNRFVVDGDVRADRIVLPKLQKEPDAGEEKPGDERRARTFKLEELPVTGRIGVDIQSIEAGSLKLSPLVAEARVSGKKLDLRIDRAALCGITLAGGIVGEVDDLQLNGTLSAREASFGDSIACLTDNRVKGSGSMDVEAHLSARGALKALRENLAGSFSLTARDGNLEKFDALNRVFAVLNVTEIARGKQLAFSEKGMRYRVTNVKGTLEGKVLHFDEFTLDSPTVYLAATGRVDYGSGKMAMDVLVAPLQTANAMLDKIPVLKRIFGSAILALPVQIVGTVQHPIVVPLGPGAVATRMTSIIANTLKLPFDAIKVFSPNAAEGAKAPEPK